MPNWSYNDYAVKAATENVLEFVNEGLKNLGLETKNNIKDAIECLWNGKNDVNMSTFRPVPETFEKYDTTNGKWQRYDMNDENKPVFKSDEEYETYSREYDEAVRYQKDTYGVVGWYDYNNEVAYGCKWDAEVELKSYSVDEVTGTTTIYMFGQTPWNFPYLWLTYIKDTFDLNVYVCSQEEANLYNAYGEIDSVDFEFGKKYFSENGPKWEDYGDERVVEYYKDYYKCYDELYKEMMARLSDCMEGTGEQ